MKHIRAIINSVTKSKPRLLTLYTNYSNVSMLRDFETYALVNQGIFLPKTRELLPNLLSVMDARELDFDLCVSFSGGHLNNILADIAKDRGIDIITYEMNFMKDLRTDIGYIASNKNSYFPSVGMAKKCYGNEDNILIPNVNAIFNSVNPILNRQIDIACFGEFLIEKEEETNFSEWKYITNTIPSAIYGFNPKINSYNPRLEELPSIYNQVKVVLNTKTHGLFPMELLEAICCGCIAVSYPFPGIEDFPGVKVVNSKEECRQYISDLLYNKEKLKAISDFNSNNGLYFKQRNDIMGLILKKWRDINEFGFQHYRLSRV